MQTASKVVLKFGGSVLTTTDDLHIIRAEIERFLRQNNKVVAVVSAYFGVTEKLITEANLDKLDRESISYVERIASGENASAADLVKNLNDHSINACCKFPAELNFVALGDRYAATPQGLDAKVLLEALNTNDVIVVPGFSAIDKHGNCVLLGRGGSDISAVCIAEALKLDRVRLVKDVDGVYDSDPNICPTAQRLEEIDYQSAREIAGELIQTEAIDFAERRDIKIEIAAIGHPCRSRISALPVKVVSAVSQ